MPEHPSWVGTVAIQKYISVQQNTFWDLGMVEGWNDQPKKHATAQTRNFFIPNESAVNSPIEVVCLFSLHQRSKRRNASASLLSNFLAVVKCPSFARRTIVEAAASMPIPR